MMNAMIAQCCGDDGKPDFDLMKQFMEHCGKREFSDADLQMMKQFCDEEGMPDMAKMNQIMESCGCHTPAWAQKQ